MNSYESIFKEMGESARAASIVLQQLPEVRINEILCDMADALVQHSEQILIANNMDMDSARGVVPDTMLDRLLLSKDRIHQMAEGVRQVSLLPSPVGSVLENIDRPNGLHIEKRAVPFGVIGIIFEARPNVTVDAGALCFKTANATILRGGKEAFRTNRIIVSIMQDVLEAHDLPREAIQLVEVLDREAVSVLLQQRRYIDVVIPRGGAGLIQRVVRDSMIPVIETGSGICHTYVDAEANIDMAVDIAVNAKVQRPSVCNSMETLLVHSSIAKEFLLALETKLVHHHVTIHGTPEVLQIVNGVAVEDNSFGTEYNDFDLNVAIVSSVDEAISHINRYTTHHSEAIVTDNNTTAQHFMNLIDCSTVYHNASTRFTDGFEFGFGAEIGISTQKLHARGPMGLQALTSYKYFVFGTGQIRS
ncbi:glutamate-5-semialdehyde dehydrogenase [Veillonella sp. T34266-5]|uniref:glutamate-5-semialdehyde dehydrogenase n=1 Tax=Veillonella sp. T34266-5 TaxID=2027457 RepID=UPI000CF3BC05|nr:glutamate-5-semialdehyde dehydrogenase [Veillonella sp. T34266-5]PQL21737.1 glutamate-5-semialdehyde dehydrogenase [Veillonella sp. T34266-5]